MEKEGFVGDGERDVREGEERRQGNLKKAEENERQKETA